MAGTVSNGSTSTRRRSFWFDPRFAIGLALVVLSVIGVVGLVSAANASVDVLAAVKTLTPGERITASDLVSTSVRAGRLDNLYLQSKDVPRGGLVVTRGITAGELVPTSAVGSEAGAGLTSVVVSVSGGLAASINPGARIDLWAAAHTDTSSYATPGVLVPSAIVVRVLDQKNLVGAGTDESVELLVPKSATAGVLDAVANGANLSVVPVDLPLGQ